ncbi:MAG: hypothetical protein WBA68_00220 [Alteraurantiacibacter sp.]
MKHLFLLPFIALAACGAQGEGPDMANDSQDARDFATQTEAPSPDYEAIIRNAPRVEFDGLRREGTPILPANARQIGEIWLERLNTLGVVDGYGLDGKGEDGPITNFSIVMTPADFDAWVAENGWTAPPHLGWSFVPELRTSRVSEAAARGIRIWPASEQRAGMLNEAADGGRIVLRDGCFYLQQQGNPSDEKLAWFHAETGLDIDAEGYYVLVNRVTGQVAARVGEMVTWAAPNPIRPGGPSMIEFRAACGDGEIVTVGNPTSDARMNAMYPQPRAPDAAPPPGIE